MRRIFTLLLLLVLLVPLQLVHAQGMPALSSADVWVWPEYDKAGVLVIQRMTVSAGTTLPAAMTFRIPATAGKPYAMAMGPTADQVGDATYTLKQNGDWMEITVQVTAPAIQLEYYDPALNKDGKARQYTYRWTGDYAVDQLHIELQQPFDASAMQTVPTLPDSNVVADGVTYYTGSFGPFTQGQEFTLDVNYQKDSDALTISFLNVQPSAPVDANTAGRISFDTYLPWLVGAFGVLMIAGGLFYYFRGTARPRSTTRRRHVSSEEAAAGQTYCPQCGTRARNGDRFCRTCGTRLRTEVDS